MATIFTQSQRREIAGRARTLHERLEGPLNDPGSEPPIPPEQVLGEWIDQFPDEASFHKRLEKEGFSEEEIRDQLGATRWPEDEPLPEWIDELEAVTRHIESEGIDETAVAVPDDTPFAEFLGAFTEFASDKLPDSLVPTGTKSDFEAFLVNRLREVCTRPLYVEFKSFVEYHDPELVEADPSAFDDPPTEHYEQFLEAMADGGVRDLWLEYPVLARHVVRRIRQWHGSVIELCRRLRSDGSALAAAFGVDGSIVGFEALATDAHADGRVPFLIEFESGSAVYKPRPVDAGEALYTVLDRLANHDAIPAFRTPTYLSREGYGWMAPVEHQDPLDEAAASDYYERAGALLCVAYVLNVTDCQVENLLVDRDQPTIVDGETVLFPHVSWEATTDDPAVSALLQQSVLHTGLLPKSTATNQDQHDSDLSTVLAGFATDGGKTEVSGQTRPTVQATNTDVMTVTQTPISVDRSTNTPTLDGEDRPPGAHLDALVGGFERAYRRIQNLHATDRFRSEVLEPDLIEGIENRLIYRPSMQYGSVIRSAVARDPLRDGARFTVELEELAVPFFDGRIESDRCWPLYAAERAALRRLDVPRITSRVDDTALLHDGEPVGVEADASGYRRCRRRLQRMDDDDRRWQARLIESCFDTDVPDATAPAPEKPSSERLHRTANELVDDAMASVIERGNRPVVPAITGSEHRPTLTIAPSDDSLYGGRAGIALAAAALYAETGIERYRRRARDLLDAVAQSARDTPFDPGGLTGTGSAMYALTTASDLLNTPEYGSTAAELAASVPDDSTRTDSSLDVVGGTAGTLLALLACYDAQGDQVVSDRAIACGERLLDTRIVCDGHRAWPTVNDEPTAGFAHGTAGIAYALARLGATVNEDRFVRAARDAFAAEQSLDWSTPGQGDHARQWCYGPTGIGLARVETGRLLGDQELLEAGRELLSSPTSFAPYDNVCCGNFGRVDALIAAGGPLVDEARELAGRCLARRSETGSFSLPGQARPVVNPLFFDGVSGAAYVLLRLCDPSLPSVLLLE